MSISEKAIIRAQLALVKATEGSFDSDEGVQQLHVIINLLATARRVVVRQQRTIDVLRSPSKQRCHGRHRRRRHGYGVRGVDGGMLTYCCVE